MDTQAQTITQAQAHALAEQVGKTMYAIDTATKDTMGITLQECAPGRATMRMEVKPLHLIIIALQQLLQCLTQELVVRSM